MAVQIVAEVGINHSGFLDTALRLIDAAKVAGADVVKFQKREPRLSVPRSEWDKPRSTPWGDMTYIEYKERIEFGRSDYDIIDAYCKGLGIPWTASAWDIPSVDFLERYGIPFHKVPSACLTDEALLDRVAQMGRPVVLSTGMSTMEEVWQAVEIFREQETDLTILHCNSTYPCPTQDLNLRCIETLRREFPDAKIGYSGHETGLATTVAAVALGVSMVERHITLDRSMWGTDQAASVEPQGFTRLVRDIRNVEAALGNGVKRVTEGELEPRRRLRGVPA